MKRHLQCAEQQASPSNVTKYCACHVKRVSSLIFVTYESSFTMRGATGITLQPHQILRLPRKMSLMHDVHHIWNVIYNARSNSHHPPTSPNAAPATQNASHAWCPSHMKRHLQCAEQQASTSNLTKCCACHTKWVSCMMSITYETSFTMRGATGITLQPHQMLRLPRKMTVQNLRKTLWKQLKWQLQCGDDSTMIRPWSEHELVISHPPVRGGSFSHFGDAFCIENYNISRSGYLPRFHRILRLPQKVTLQEHQILRLPQKVTLQDPSNLTKYCAWHAKWVSCMMSITYETSFTMRGATGINLQPHQILRLPHKMSLMHDVHHIWNVIYNARSNRHQPPTSPNAAPATQNASHAWCPSHMKRHLQCAEQQASPSNLTKCCACHTKWVSCMMSITYETSFTMRGATGITLQPHQMLRLPRKMTVQNLRKTLWKQLKWQLQCGDDSTMIRPWSEHELVISHPPVRGGSFSHFGDAFCIENYNISRSGYLPRFHRILRLPQKVTLQEHQILRLPQQVTLQDHQILRLPQKVTLQDHQILRLPQKINCYWAVTQLSCYWTVTQLSCYWTVTELSCYWTVTELSWTCYSTELLLNCYSSELLLNCYPTELNLLLKWAVAELLLKWAVTELLLNWAVTELLLNWAEPVTQLSWTCYSTELLLNCYSTELLLNCYSSELLLNWAVIAFLKLRNSEVSHLNFLWLQSSCMHWYSPARLKSL